MNEARVGTTSGQKSSVPDTAEGAIATAWCGEISHQGAPGGIAGYSAENAPVSQRQAEAAGSGQLAGKGPGI